MDRVVIYTRVSTDNGKQSVDRQESDLKSYCAFKKLQLVDIFSENVSGTKTLKNRPELMRLMNFVSNPENKIDGVIVTEISRLGRNMLDVVTNIHTLLDLNIYVDDTKLKTIENGQKNSIAIGFLSLLGSFAESERETIILRSKSGIREKVINHGHFTGGLFFPYGFKKVDKKLVIDVDEAKIIVHIYSLLLEGFGIKVIVNKLNEMGENAKTRSFKINEARTEKKKQIVNKWTEGTVYGILKNTIYIGLRNFKNEKLPYNKDLQIIDNDTFYKVQQILKERYHNLGGIKKYTFLLNNKKIVCGCCGRNFFPSKRANPKLSSAYMCLSTRYFLKDKRECENYGISIDKIENLTNSVILYHLSDLLKSKIDSTEFTEKINDIQTEIDSISNQIRKAKSEEKKFIDYALDTNISKDTFKSKIDDFQTKIETLQNRILSLNNDLATNKLLIDNIKDIELLRNKFRKEGYMLDKKIVNSIIEKIVITGIEFAAQNEKDALTNLQLKHKFSKKHDRQLIVVFHSGKMELKYMISQRQDYVFDFQQNRILNIVLSDRDIQILKLNAITKFLEST
jgi:DNA invertase Pin-like site-specific DNA recombinase